MIRFIKVLPYTVGGQSSERKILLGETELSDYIEISFVENLGKEDFAYE